VSCILAAACWQPYILSSSSLSAWISPISIIEYSLECLNEYQVWANSEASNYRATTCLENLEMSGNLTAVREMSGILL